MQEVAAHVATTGRVPPSPPPQTIILATAACLLATDAAIIRLRLL
jgi:hypothetical protein